MKGFWDTWLHISIGLSFAVIIGGVVYMIYDIGRIHGRIEMRQGQYDKGFADGKDRGYRIGYCDGLRCETHGRSK